MTDAELLKEATERMKASDELELFQLYWGCLDAMIHYQMWRLEKKLHPNFRDWLIIHDPRQLTMEV